MSVANGKVYVVVRQAFAWCGNLTPYSDDTPLKAFSDRTQAESYLDRCWRNLDEDGVVFEIVEMELPEEGPPPRAG